jgi:Terminase large subunit, T4likevirus-type, N-terminal/Terminase RNaseH-like domain
MTQTVELFKHQHDFVTDIDHRYIAISAGYGAGKSFAFAMKAIHLASLNCLTIGDHVGILCEPTYPLISDVLIPALEECLELCGIPYKTTSGNKPECIMYFPNGKATVLLRSAENYKRIVGVNAAWAGVDELDTMDTKTAKAAWKKIQGRLRAKDAVTQLFTTSTPEGFRFFQQFFVTDAAESEEKRIQRRIIYASTYDNTTLPADFIKDLETNYTEEERAAYLSGQFVNMVSGRIYKKFNRIANRTNLTVDSLKAEYKTKKDPFGQSVPLPQLHIGMDFNIGKMAAIVHVILNDKAYAIDELINLEDTEAMCEVIKERYPEFRINVYPDSSGKNRAHVSVAADTDITLLKKAGFSVIYNNQNPPVKDRINSMNQAFMTTDNDIRYYVNDTTCPKYTTCLEQQTYDEYGQPDKKNDFDHPNDAAGYFIHSKFPVKRYHAGGLRMIGT